MSAKTQLWRNLKEFTADAKQDHPKMSIEAFLIKNAHKRNQLEKFTTHRFQISDELAQAFRNILGDSLQEHGFGIESREAPTIKEYEDPSLEKSEELFFITKSLLKELNGLIDDLEKHNDKNPIEEPNTISGASLYCFEARLELGSVFVIAAIHNLYQKNDQQLITAEFKKEQMTLIERNIIQFSKDILCIYVNDLELLLIIDSINTTKKLGFKDQFKSKAKNIILDDWEVIEIPDDRLDAVLANNQCNQLLMQIHSSNRLRNNIDHYHKYNEFCKNNPDLELEPIEIENNRLMITKSKHLANALYVSDNSIVTGVLIEGEYSIALKRKLLGRRHRRR